MQMYRDSVTKSSYKFIYQDEILNVMSGPWISSKEVNMTNVILSIQAYLEKFGFKIIKLKKYKTSFFVVGRAKFVSILVTYGQRGGFCVEVIPNKEFLGVASGYAPLRFESDKEWEIKFLRLIRRALKHNKSIENNMHVAEKFKEIAIIKLRNMAKINY